MQYINILTVVSFLSAFIALASRLFVASRPFWSRLPAFYQAFLPALLPALATLAQGLTGVKNWGDLSVQFMVCAAMLLPGLPSNRSAAPMQAGKIATATPSAGDVAVASALNSGSIRPAAPKDGPKPPTFGGMGPMGGMLALCLVLSTLAGCAAFAAAVPVIAEVGTIIADAVNDLDYVEQIVATFPGLSGTQRSAIETKLQAARLALQAAAAADSGAGDITAAQLDASLTAFRTAWADLSAALADAGITTGAKFGATASTVSIPSPLALRPVTK